MSKVMLLTSTAAVALYSAAAYNVLLPNSNIGKQLVKHGLAIPKHVAYGPLRFLTNQCLLVQLTSALLHALVAIAPRVRILRATRDLLFSASALPLSLLVASTFWAVYAINRELIFPTAFDAVIPSWINHTVHTIIVPINICFALLDSHKFKQKLGVFFLLTHLISYLILLINIKSATGSYVYPYLDALGGQAQVYAYFAATALLLLLLYKLGELFTLAVQPFHSTKQQTKKTSNKKNI